MTELLWTNSKDIWLGGCSHHYQPQIYLLRMDSGLQFKLLLIGGEELVAPAIESSIAVEDAVFEVPEAHHPRATTLREALRGNLPLRGFSGLSEGLFKGFAGSLRGSAGFSEGSEPILVTLGNCWSVCKSQPLSRVCFALVKKRVLDHSATIARSSWAV